MFVTASIHNVANKTIDNIFLTLPIELSIVLNEPEMLAAAFLPEGPTSSISPLNFLTSPLALRVSAEKLRLFREFRGNSCCGF